MSKRKQARGFVHSSDAYPAGADSSAPVKAGSDSPAQVRNSFQTTANRTALYVALAFYLGWLLFLLLAAWGVIR